MRLFVFLLHTTDSCHHFTSAFLFVDLLLATQHYVRIKIIIIMIRRLINVSTYESFLSRRKWNYHLEPLLPDLMSRKCSVNFMYIGNLYVLSKLSLPKKLEKTNYCQPWPQIQAQVKSRGNEWILWSFIRKYLSANDNILFSSGWSLSYSFLAQSETFWLTLRTRHLLWGTRCIQIVACLLARHCH